MPPIHGGPTTFLGSETIPVTKHFQSWDNFSCKTLSKETFSWIKQKDISGDETFLGLWHFQMRHFQESRKKTLSVTRHFRCCDIFRWDTFRWDTFGCVAIPVMGPFLVRPFRLQDTFGYEITLVLRHLQVWGILDSKTPSSVRHLHLRGLFNQEFQ